MKKFWRFSRLVLQVIGLCTVIGVLLVLIALPLLPRILQVEDKIEKADYILPLAGEWHRYLSAAELYKDGYAPVVLISNARDREPTRFDTVLADMGVEIPTRSRLRRRVLVHLGVPEAALEEFGRGHISTAEEAEALRNFLSTKTHDRPVRVIVVTSAYHTRRAALTLRDTMPGVDFMMTSTPERKLQTQWWRDRDSAIRSVLESFKFAHYLLGGRFRSSDPLARKQAAE